MSQNDVISRNHRPKNERNDRTIRHTTNTK